MGNQNASDSEVTKDESTAAAAAAPDQGTTTLNTVDTASTIPKLSIKDIETSTNTAKSRRIVKANHPKKGASMENLAVLTAANNDDDDDDGVSKVETSKKPVAVWESPSVAREIEQEKAASQKQARVKTAEERQRSTREKKLHDRRLLSASPESKQRKGVVVSNTEPSKTAGNAAAVVVPHPANPMSRFLSVFSVDSHPEHKRRAVTVTTPGSCSAANDEDHGANKPPDEKRPRPSSNETTKVAVVETTASSSNGKKKDNNSNNNDHDAFWIKQPPAIVAASAAVAVAAVLVGIMVLRWNNQRRW